METFNISIIRVGYSGHDFKIEANSYQEAKEEALDNAGSHDFGAGHHAEYYAEEDLPVTIGAEQVVVPEAQVAHAKILAEYIRDCEGQAFDEHCKANKAFDRGHIFYVAICHDIVEAGGTELDGKTYRTVEELDAQLIKEYGEPL